MRSNIRALTLAGIAFVILAVTPAGASADTGLFTEGGSPETGYPRIVASSYPAQITGGVIDIEGLVPGQTTLFEAEAAVACDDVEYDGGEISGPLFYELALAATYSECSAAGVSTDVDMNSCSYVYSEFTKQPGKTLKAKAEIACDEGDSITLDVGEGICTIDIPAQVLKDSGEVLDLTVSGDSKLLMAPATEELQYTAESKYGVCYLIGLEEGSGEDAGFHSDIELSRVES